MNNDKQIARVQKVGNLMIVLRLKKKNKCSGSIYIHLNFKVIARRFAITSRNLGCQHLINAGVSYSGQHYHLRYISSPVTGSQPLFLE